MTRDVLNILVSGMSYLLNVNLFKVILIYRYFALNTEMRHKALQTGSIYFHQNPHDSHLTVDELRQMSGDSFSNRVLHFGSWNTTVLAEAEDPFDCYG